MADLGINCASRARHKVGRDAMTGVHKLYLALSKGMILCHLHEDMPKVREDHASSNNTQVEMD